MPEINLSFKEKVFSLGITKFERKKVYGYTSVKVTDENDSNCALASISDDGQHILSKGCVGYTYLNEKNEYVASSSIKVVDQEGVLLEKIPSSFDLEQVKLEESSLDEFFKLAVKSVYQLNPDEESEGFHALLELLKVHKIFKFDFNYRSDYDTDDAFLIHKESMIFMVIGQVSPFEFIGLENTTQEMVDEEDEDDDDLDFGML